MMRADAPSASQSKTNGVPDQVTQRQSRQLMRLSLSAESSRHESRNACI